MLKAHVEIYEHWCRDGGHLKCRVGGHIDCGMVIAIDGKSVRVRKLKVKLEDGRQGMAVTIDQIIQAAKDRGWELDPVEVEKCRRLIM